MSEDNKSQNQSAIARIYSYDKEIVGTGFLIAGGYVLTCAHVIKAALGNLETTLELPIEKIELDFPMADSQKGEEGVVKKLWTKVVVWLPKDAESQGLDIAILKLQQTEQFGIQPIQLKSSSSIKNCQLEIFGFLQGDPEGRWAQAISVGGIASGWMQIKNDSTGNFIDEGFSGAPVWEINANSYVGMVVAKDELQPEAKVSFFIPKKSLVFALNKLDLHSLAQILQPQWQIHRDLIKKAYYICCHEDLTKDLNNVEEILEDFNGRPESLYKFTVCLIANKTLDESFREQLRQWVTSQVEDEKYLGLLQWAEEKWNIQKMGKPYLLVQAKPTTKSDAYDVEAWFIEDVNSYNPNSGSGSRKFIFPSEAPMCLEDIPALINSCLETIHISYSQCTIDVFLSKECLSYAIDHWRRQDQFGAVLPLYGENKILLRSYDKVLPRYTKKGQWEVKWKQLQNVLDTIASQVLTQQDPVTPETRNKLVNSYLSLPSIVGLEFKKILPAQVIQDLALELALILSTGIPVALWRRQDFDRSTCQQRFEAMLACEIQNLPEQVNEIRKDAFDECEQPTNNADHIGHHISLLWDDFNRVPPQISYSSIQL
jgi:vWA-MoxR associated protein C-terminal domain/vWA-MoxR associated protein middle region (VMAP-M) 1/Trypsin-like peptidase domain